MTVEAPGPDLLTIGHGTATAEDLIALLRFGGAQVVADVRRFPGSRRSPHLAREALDRALGEHGIGYRWLPALGGRRSEPPHSPDTWWTVAAFRGYAAHMRTDEFRAGIGELLALEARAAVMCSETLWWRCHRRLIADHLVAVCGLTVAHLMPGPAMRPHVLTAGARITPAGLVYDRTD